MSGQTDLSPQASLLYIAEDNTQSRIALKPCAQLDGRSQAAVWEELRDCPFLLQHPHTDGDRVLVTSAASGSSWEGRAGGKLASSFSEPLPFLHSPPILGGGVASGTVSGQGVKAELVLQASVGIFIPARDESWAHFLGQ